MDAAGAIALRKYVKAQTDAGFVSPVSEQDRSFEPTGLSHIDAYVRAFHEAEAEPDA